VLANPNFYKTGDQPGSAYQVGACRATWRIASSLQTSPTSKRLKYSSHIVIDIDKQSAKAHQGANNM